MDQTAGIPTLYCDDDLLVVNKPAGISTLPDGYNPTLPHIKSVLEQQYGRLWIVHRLDKETSGVLVLARSAVAHRSLNTQFEHHTVSKRYHALVEGCPEWSETTVSQPLRPNGDRQHRTVVDPRMGKPAVTHFKVLERFEYYCLLEALPETGRTHQIRAHLTVLGLFIVGDKLYTRRLNQAAQQTSHQVQADQNLLNEMGGSMGLHAISLEVSHPLSGKRMKFTAPYPSSLAVVLRRLRAAP